MKCVITYKGKDYSYAEFNALLHDGLLEALVNNEVVSIEGAKISPAKTEQFQKPSFNQKDFDLYRKKIGVDVESEKQYLRDLNKSLKEENLSQKDVELIESEIADINDTIEKDKVEYELFLKNEERINKIDSSESLDGIPLDELKETYLALYKEARDRDAYPDKKKMERVKNRIAYVLGNVQKEELEKLHGKEISEMANKRDMTWREVWFKAMGHVSEEFPEIQALYNEFNQAHLNKERESHNLKSKIEKAGKAVIEEENKRLGVANKVLSFFSSNSAKYFEYMEKDGKFLTEAEAANLSPAKKEFLELMRELVAQKNELSGKDTDDVIKIDKGFQEAWKSGSFIEAMSLYMGGGNNVDVEVTYINPLTGKQEKAPYKEAQKNILDWSKKGHSVAALTKLFLLAQKAKRAAFKSSGNLNYEGALTSKFDKLYDKTVGYSKDYYAAAMQLADDIAHVKNMNKVIPMVNAVEQFYKNLGIGKDKTSFNNTIKFLKEWKEEQVYQKSKMLDPTIDPIIKFLRRATSMTVMGFNIPAGKINLIIGNYNAWRAEGGKAWAIGQKRLFGNLKKAGAILRNHDVVGTEFHENPKLYAGKLFDLLAYGATKYGERQIQGSLFFGLMDKDVWDSFDNEGNLKPGADKAKVDKEIQRCKDRVSDIQGKYNEKDRRNFMRLEFGRAASQFKVWMPDWFKERFGGEYIDSKGISHRGSWRMMSKQAIKDFKEDIAQAKYAEATKKAGAAIMESKQFKQNLRGALTIGALLLLTWDDDDEKEITDLENIYSQIMGMYDLKQDKYLIKSTVPALGTVEKFIDAIDGAIKGNEKKFEKNAKKLVPYNKLSDLPENLGITEKKK